jgi:hypothetical protein
MASLTDSELENVNPDMTLKDIKKYTKECISGTTSVAGTDDDVPHIVRKSKDCFVFYQSKDPVEFGSYLSDSFKSDYNEMLNHLFKEFNCMNLIGCVYKIIVERNKP